MSRSSDSNFLLALLRDKTFQAREIRRVVGLSFIYLVATTAILGFFYHQMLGNLLDGMAPLFFVSEDMQLVNEAVPSLSTLLGKWIIAMMVLNALITVCLGIYITRRLGHPLMAIKRTLREIGAGNLDVRLRASDSKDFGEIAHELTAAMRLVREQIAAAKQQIDSADELVNQPEPRSESVDAALRNCKLALDYFQVDSEHAGENDTPHADAA